MKDLEYIWVAMGFGVRDDDTLRVVTLVHSAWRMALGFAFGSVLACR